MPEDICSATGSPCTLAVKVESIEKELTDQKEERIRSHKSIYDRLSELETGRATLAAQYTHISNQLTALSADIAAIRDRPAKRWETVVTAIITGVVGFVLAYLGLSK